MTRNLVCALILTAIFLPCWNLPAGQAVHQTIQHSNASGQKYVAVCCESGVRSRFVRPGLILINLSALKIKVSALKHTRVAPALHPGMVYIRGGTYLMGASGPGAAADELPRHRVTVRGFWIDQTELTNAAFTRFVRATGYKTTAERAPDWNDVKKELPPGTPRPADSLLVPAALVFAPSSSHVTSAGELGVAGSVAADAPGTWWNWKKGASWRHPHGPGSNLAGKENYPVVQVSWADACAYCRWAHKRLPTEAEWEWAGRGGLTGKEFPWGNEPADEGSIKANTWQGSFPQSNTVRDRYYFTAPVGSYLPNGYGLYDMAGNVWEWCADNYSGTYYSVLSRQALVINPRGPASAYDPEEPYARKRVIRGGSFLCNDSYCAGYRVSARMKSTEDTSLEHLGFRCVAD